jgi:DNA-binding NtrC family response regulator
MKNKAKIILADLDGEMSSALRTYFENQGNEVVVGFSAGNSFAQPAIVLGFVSKNNPAVNVVKSIKEKAALLPIILLISPDTTESTTSALMAGADYACEQFVRLEDLKILVDRASAQTQQTLELHSLREQIEKNGVSGFGALLSDFPTLDELEKRYLKIVLDKTRGRKEKASRILGINRRTLYRKEREYGWVSDDESELANEPKEQPPARFS